MKVLFVGHDLTYARFYAAIEHCLKNRAEVVAQHVYFRPSAFLFAKHGLGLRCSSPSLRRLLVTPRASSEAPPASIDFRFYEPTTAVQRQFLTRLYQAYLAFLKPLFEREAYDVCVLPGEFRLMEQAVLAALKAGGQTARILYFEAGPPGYVYFDPSGVNANASFTSTGKSELLTQARSESPGARVGAASPLGKPVRRGLRPLLLCVDVAWIFLAKITQGLGDLEEYWVATRNRLRRLSAPAAHDGAPSEGRAVSRPPGASSLVVYVGQVRNDINHTHFGVTAAELGRRLTHLLESDPTVFLVWRDHPLERSDALFLQLSAAFPGRVGRSGARSLRDDLQHAQGVVTVNSNGGLEALAAGLPVLLLGRAYFENLVGVWRDDAAFGQQRIAAARSGPDPAIGADAARFLRDCFLPIDYRGEDFRNAHLAAQALLVARH